MTTTTASRFPLSQPLLGNGQVGLGMSSEPTAPSPRSPVKSRASGMIGITMA